MGSLGDMLYRFYGGHMDGKEKQMVPAPLFTDIRIQVPSFHEIKLSFVPTYCAPEIEVVIEIYRVTGSSELVFMRELYGLPEPLAPAGWN